MAESFALARPYAKAVFELATAEKDFSSWSVVLSALTEVAIDPKVKMFIRNPMISTENLVDFFTASLALILREQLNEKTENFIKILAVGKKLLLLPEITQLYENFRDQAENRVEVEVTTAVALDEKQKKQFGELLEKNLNKTPTIRLKQNSDLIGGFIVQVGDDVLDASIQGLLLKLKKEMLGGVYAN